MLRRLSLFAAPGLSVLLSACADDVVGTVVAAIEVAPAQVELGATPVGGLKSHPIEIRSVGSAVLAVKTITLLGANGMAVSEDLALSIPDTLPKSLAAQQTMTFSLDHLPRDLVLDSGVIRVESDDPANPAVDVPIVQTGSGAPRVAGVPDADAAKVEARTPGGIQTFIEAVHLGQVDVGIRKRSTFHLVNAGTGNVPLNVTRVRILEANAELDATVTPLAPLVLPPLGAQGLRPSTVLSTAVEVSWAPSRTGETLAATLRVESNDPARPMLDIPITGNTVVVDPPILRLEPPTGIDFGNVRVGMGAQQTLTLHNDGLSPLPLETLTLSSTAVFSFQAAQGPSSIMPGSSRSVVLIYRPRAVGAHAANIAIVSASPSIMPSAYPLRGTGFETMTCTPVNVDPNEPTNDTCATATARPPMTLIANQETVTMINDAQIELGMDTDWQRFVLEVDAGCSAGVGYEFRAQVQLGAGEQGEVCVYAGDCTNPTRQACAVAGNDARVLILFGQTLCDTHNNQVPVFVRVRHTGGEPLCMPYALTFRAR